MLLLFSLGFYKSVKPSISLNSCLVYLLLRLCLAYVSIILCFINLATFFLVFINFLVGLNTFYSDEPAKEKVITGLLKIAEPAQISMETNRKESVSSSEQPLDRSSLHSDGKLVALVYQDLLLRTI